MLVPINWLKEYVEIKADSAEFCEKMILSGSNIETTKKLIGSYAKIIVGKIVKMEKHPEADKLFVTQIDTGSGVTQIITGADNIFEGACIPVILDGGVLPTGTKIKKGKLRGLESNGMLCSPDELGFEDKVIPACERDGIMILRGEYTLGQDISEALGVADEEVIEFEITPNRPDCLSLLGIAREAAAVFGEQVKYPQEGCGKEEGDIRDYIDVKIKRPDLCKRYVARAAKDVKIAPSPWWMQEKLMASGVRPINNIVDITNFVMLEYGQPIHAFDLRQIEENQIIVDTCADGQKFTTLDGSERDMTKDSLLICDGKKPVALAGVMGGLNSEIRDDTTMIMIECANFDADNIRSTSKRIGLRTEASARYERGLDPNLCKKAADRVCHLIELLGAGTVIKGAVDEYPGVTKPWTVKVRTARINQILGTNLTPQETAAIFSRLEIKTDVEGDVVLATPPTVRIDLLEEIDFVEEAARMYGYDVLLSTLPKSDTKGGKNREQKLEDLAKNTLIALGYSEIQTYSFVSPGGVDNIQASGSHSRDFVRIINPLGEENSVMRTMLIPNMLEVLSCNYSRSIEEVRAFELGKVFINMEKNKDGEALPVEIKNLLAGAYGPKENFYTLKGAVVEMLTKIGVKNLSFEAETQNPTFHPGRMANIVSGEQKIGIIGELHPDITEKYDIRTRVYLAEFDFDRLTEISDTQKRYVPIPRYPAVQRDIAMVVREEVSVGDMESIIKNQGRKLLEDIQLFDIYRGEQVKEGCKSVAFSLRYRDAEKTLTEEEVARVHKKVLDALRNQLDAELREM